MKRRLLALAAALTAAALAGAVLWPRAHLAVVAKAGAVEAGAGSGAGAEPVQTVSAVEAVRTPWHSAVDAVGDLRAVRGADLSAETAGIVAEIDFTSGADVRAGTVLLRLRLNDEPGRLAQLRADADLAALNLNRDRREFQAQAVSHAVVDTDTATLAADRAQVDAEQALIEEKIVRAPFDGKLGVRQVDLGQYLQPGTAIVTLQALDPIYVDFYLPQAQLGYVAAGATVEVTVDTYPGRVFTAHVSALAPKVDAASRTAQVRATIANPDHALLPGMFAQVRLRTGAARSLVTLPQTAVTYATFGDTVFVVVPGRGGRRVARQVLVRTGPSRGEQVAILSGLSGGETVVTAGQIKLHEGTPVEIDNAVPMGARAQPNPPEE